MNYTHNTKPDTDALEVAEPATLCYGGRSTVAEPDWASEAGPGGDWDDDVDYGAPESVTVHSYEELCRKLEEGLDDIRAGRVYRWEDVKRELRRKYFNEAI